MPFLTLAAIPGGNFSIAASTRSVTPPGIDHIVDLAARAEAETAREDEDIYQPVSTSVVRIFRQSYSRFVIELPVISLCQFCD